MIKLLFPLEKNLIVACSGGVDSMAALDFLSRNHDVTVAFFDHKTQASCQALMFLATYCKFKNIPMEIGVLDKEKPKNKSLEEFWRDERYRWLDKLSNDLNQPIITAHHLDDAVETWVWSSLHGQSKLPQLKRGNVLRPFLSTPKSELMDWCIRKSVPWHDDMSNHDQKFVRNYIRHTMMPMIQTVNPGIQKTIKKKLTEATKIYIV